MDMPGRRPGRGLGLTTARQGPSIGPRLAVVCPHAPRHSKSALHARVDTMVDACTRCGKCVEACPTTVAAGLTADERRNPVAVIGGIIDILRGQSTEAGNGAARKWASGCMLSGDCIEACDYGVNPRFLLHMARVALVRGKDDAATQRKNGVEGFRKVASDVKHISRLQLDDALLGAARAGRTKPRPLAGQSSRGGPISSSTPAATCSRRRTSRSLRSTSWMRSAPATR